MLTQKQIKKGEEGEESFCDHCFEVGLRIAIIE